MQRETRPAPAPADPNDPIAKQAELIQALEAPAALNLHDAERRERLKAAYLRVDGLVRRRNGWSDHRKPPPRKAPG
jgi:hypothetical protein